MHWENNVPRGCDIKDREESAAFSILEENGTISSPVVIMDASVF